MNKQEILKLVNLDHFDDTETFDLGMMEEHNRLMPILLALIDSREELRKALEIYKMDGCVKNKFGEVEWARKALAADDKIFEGKFK